MDSRASFLTHSLTGVEACAAKHSTTSEIAVLGHVPGLRRTLDEHISAAAMLGSVVRSTRFGGGQGAVLTAEDCPNAPAAGPLSG